MVDPLKFACDAVNLCNVKKRFFFFNDRNYEGLLNCEVKCIIVEKVGL